MNIAEIRNKYPQYNDLSDEQLAKGLYAKFYSDMPFDDFSRRIGLSRSEASQIILSGEQKAKIAANNAAYNKKHKNINRFLSGLREMNVDDWLDVAGQSLQGIERVADGATLGAYGWANRRLGGNYEERKERLQRQAEQAGVGTLNTLTGAGLELGGNIAGAGGVLFKGLSQVNKLGKGARLASAAGGVEGAIMGATSSDSLDEAAGRSAFGAAGGALLGAAGYKVFSTIGSLFRSNPKRAVDYMRRELGDEATETMIKEAQESGRSIAEVADDKALQIIQGARQQTSEARNIISRNIEAINEASPERSRAFINEQLGTRGRLETLDEIEETARRRAAPLYDRLEAIDDLDAYESNMIRRYSAADQDYQPILKSIRRNMQKNDPNFSMAKTPEGNIDYPHFLKDRQRAEYITTLPKTYRNPDDVFLGENDGKMREYLVKKYYNPENGKDVYDIGIKSNDGTLINKFAREGRTGKEYVKKLETGQARISTDGATSRTGQMESASVPAGQPTNNISSIDTVVKGNPFLQDEIRKIQRNKLYSKDIGNGGDRSFKLLDAVKKKIDGAIGAAIRKGVSNEVRVLQQHKQELVDAIDAATGGEYKQAREIYENRFRLEEASKMAQDIFSSKVDAPSFSRKVDKLGKTERDSMKIGLRDELYNIIGNRANESVAFNKLLPANVQAKIRKVMGQKEGDRLIKFAKEEVRKYRNLNKIESGSQTAEKLRLQDIAFRPLETAASLVTRPFISGRNKAIAELMTNPSAREAERIFTQAQQPKGTERLYRRVFEVNPELSYLAAYLANRDM